MDHEELPEMVHELGKDWVQPNTSDIEIDGTHALMSSSDFHLLCDYSHSQPSGVYVGKMWKSKTGDDKWVLRWFGESELGEDYCSNNSREIIEIK